MEKTFGLIESYAELRSFLLVHGVVPRDHPTFFHKFLFLYHAAEVDVYIFPQSLIQLGFQNWLLMLVQEYSGLSPSQ